MSVSHADLIRAALEMLVGRNNRFRKHREAALGAVAVWEEETSRLEAGECGHGCGQSEKGWHVVPACPMHGWLGALVAERLPREVSDAALSKLQAERDEARAELADEQAISAGRGKREIVWRERAESAEAALAEARAETARLAAALRALISDYEETIAGEWGEGSEIGWSNELEEARAALAGLDVAPQTECVCGEINTRHCPVHGQGQEDTADAVSRAEDSE